MNEWTVYIVTDTGREVPHWADTTRAKARKVARDIRLTNPRIATRIRKEVR